MNRKLLQTIIILPGTALVFIPLTIVWLTSASRWAASWSGIGTASFWIGVLLLCAGLTLAVWTVTLFMHFGQGTPAPWDPPKKLVVRGPYRYVRNPMITSVMFMLLAEALLFRSWPMAGWLIIFFLANAIYFPLVEERGLKKRFGEDYLQYQANVPRWFPRMTPWMPRPESMGIKESNLETATFAAGCFWGVEAAFRKMDGVVDARVGYCGGHVPEASYEQVCTGMTGHAESVEVRFDPSIASYEDLLNVFWGCHDPTQLNRQGPDIGSQYRSVIFYHNKEQKEIAIASRDAHQQHLGTPVVTEIVTASPFYPAEGYHQRYLEKQGRI